MPLVPNFTKGIPLAAHHTTLREHLRRTLADQRQANVTVLSSLLAVEDALGYIPPEAVEEVAQFTGATSNDVWAVASFYTNFRFTPPGRHILEVCWGPTCHLRGAQEVLRSVQDALGLTHEGDTSDGNATLKYNTCLGACAQAPVMMVDHQLVGRVGPEQAQGLVQRLDSANGAGREMAGD